MPMSSCKESVLTLGIGFEIVKYLLQDENTAVVAVVRDPTSLQDLGEYGHRLVVVVGDVADEPTSIAAVAEAVSLGPLNAVIANAGVLDHVNSIENVPIEGWKRDFDVNFFAVVHLIQHALPELKKSGGNFVAVSSGASVSSYSGFYAYGSSKAALNHLVLSVANEEHINAISIAPGVVATKMQTDIREHHYKGMSAEGTKRFTDLFEENKLISADIPAQKLAHLALRGWDAAINGKYLRYNDPVLADY